MKSINLQGINYFLNQKFFWQLFSLFFLFLYLSPLIISGSELNFLAFDNLDSNVVWYKILAESGEIFSSNNAIIPNMMHGLPRFTYGSEFDLLLWFYYFFTPIQAYILNEIILHTVAFFSMYIFLNRSVFISNTPHKFIYVNLGALYFSILPFWPSAGLSLPLMPLVTYALLEIEQGRSKVKLWILLLLLPLYSNFILVYMFYLTLAGIYFLRQTIIKRRFNLTFFMALFLLCVMFLAKEYRLLIETFFNNSFISNRSEYFIQVNKEFIEAYRSSLLEFLDGVPHAKGLHLEFLLPVSLLTLVLSFTKEKLSTKNSLIFIFILILAHFSGIWQNVLRQVYTLPMIAILMIILIYINKGRLLASLLLIQVFIAIWFGFSFYKGWNSVFEYFPILKMINFSRFFFISPIIWSIIFAIVIKEFIEKIRFSTLLVISFISLQVYLANNNAMFGTSQQLYHLPFKKYYAKEQFDEIYKFIGKPKQDYYIINLGLPPAVTQFNGYQTLDGYMVNFPADYKHRFRKIIQKHLKKDSFNRNFFDGWGSKVYLLDNEVRYSYYNEFFTKSLQMQTYKDLDLNTSQISYMGGKYLFSVQIIEEPEQYNLTYLKTFNNPNSLWPISVYKVD